MKTLHGIKIVGFVTLASVVGLAVYAGTKDNTSKKKHHKYIVRFGWSETTANDLEPAPHSVEQIEGYLAAVDRSRYLIQYYADGQPNGSPKGDLDLCLPTPTPQMRRQLRLQPRLNRPLAERQQALRHRLSGSPSSKNRNRRMLSPNG